MEFIRLERSDNLINDAPQDIFPIYSCIFRGYVLKELDQKILPALLTLSSIGAIIDLSNEKKEVVKMYMVFDGIHAVGLFCGLDEAEFFAHQVGEHAQIVPYHSWYDSVIKESLANGS